VSGLLVIAKYSTRRLPHRGVFSVVIVAADQVVALVDVRHRGEAEDERNVVVLVVVAELLGGHVVPFLQVGKDFEHGYSLALEADAVEPSLRAGLVIDTRQRNENRDRRLRERPLP